MSAVTTEAPTVQTTTTASSTTAPSSPSTGTGSAITTKRAKTTSMHSSSGPKVTTQNKPGTTQSGKMSVSYQCITNSRVNISYSTTKLDSGLKVNGIHGGNLLSLTIQFDDGCATTRTYHSIV